LQKLTDEPGTHKISLNQTKSFFIDEFSSSSTPGKISLKNTKGSFNKELLIAENPVKNFPLGKDTVSTLKAADQITNLYYKLVKPVDFDSTKKYPVLIYVYGGPHVQLVTNDWMNRIDYFQQYMAERGFISFTLDCRGSANRGEAFEDVIHRQNGRFSLFASLCRYFENWGTWLEFRWLYDNSNDVAPTSIL
jgi:dipeptidyl-peptidase-4